MNIFLVRHFESEKNKAGTFSFSDSEHLTAKGKVECVNFSKAFCAFCNEQYIRISEIHVADSVRARESAEIISEFMNVRDLFYHPALKSTNAGRLAGKSIEETKQLDPFFYKNYYLYTKGLFNSYYFDLHWDDQSKEKKADFERRVLDCFYGVLKDVKGCSSVLFVAHRASITAILINIARLMGIYPQNFYGSVSSIPGSLSWITYEKGKWDINLVGCRVEEAEQCKEFYFGRA